jgi:hypothetical protein
LLTLGYEMNTGIATRLKRVAKGLGTICAIELCLPGGTLIALTYFLTVQCHVHGSTEGKHAVTAWRDIRGLLSADTSGGLRRAGANSAGPATANRRAASQVPPVAEES